MRKHLSASLWSMDPSINTTVLHPMTSSIQSTTLTTAVSVDLTNRTLDHSPANDVTRKVLLGIVFAVFILTAIGGNLLVCVAVLTERRLKRVKNNYFIVSLAVADLLVACVVMMFAMPNDIQQKWVFGEVFCKIWICFDIMCSTASILNLCVISFDRYKHIHNAMYYDLWMTTKKALFFIASVWILSALISFLPIHLGWHRPGDASSATNKTSSADEIHNTNDGNDSYFCVMDINFVYAIVSSTISFYAPCLVMLVLYFRLFLFARRHAITIKSMTRHHTTMSDGSTKILSNGNSKVSLKSSDHKAAFTLGVITGVFLCCWLPFFIINPISAYNQDLIHPNAFTVCTWLGYVNSCLNPIIYSIFNTEFREAFKKILSLRTCHPTDKFLTSVSSRGSMKSRTNIYKSKKNASTSNVNETIAITCVRNGDGLDEKITPL